MSEVTLLPVRSASVRTVRGLALWAAFGGLGACGTENADEGSSGDRVSQASTDTAETSANGQSGSEYDYGGNGADHPSCPCGWLNNPLRGTILEVVRHIEGSNGLPVRLGTVRLRVDELLGSTTELEIGSELSSPWFGELPCFFGCASIEVGDEVLAFYEFPRPCITTEGDDNCPLGDTIPGRISLTPWSDAPVLARLSRGDLTLAIEDIPLLESPECSARIERNRELLGAAPDDGPRCYELAPPPP
jgi:hypothetical protein